MDRISSRPADVIDNSASLDLAFDTASLEGPKAPIQARHAAHAELGRAPYVESLFDAPVAGLSSAPSSPAATTHGAVTLSPSDGAAAPPEVIARAEPVERHAPKQERKRHRNVPVVAKLVPILIGVLGGMVLMLIIPRPQDNQPTTAPSGPAALPVAPHPVASQPLKPERPSESADDTTTTIGPIELAAVAPPKSGAARTKSDSPAPLAGGGAAAPASTINTSLSGLSGLVAGPTAAAAAAPAAAGGSGGPLNEGDIARVVQGRRAFVSRRCWEPALAAKPPNLPASAKVNVTLSITADGRVSDAVASGGDGFPGLAGCVQGQVRTWTFPRNDGQSAIKIPFVFAGQ